jgi:hypothetical protein
MNIEITYLLRATLKAMHKEHLRKDFKMDGRGL